MHNAPRYIDQFLDFIIYVLFKSRDIADNIVLGRESVYTNKMGHYDGVALSNRMKQCWSGIPPSNLLTFYVKYSNISIQSY